MSDKTESLIGLVLGSSLMLIALWVGSYVGGKLPYGSWANFPTFVTAMAVFCLGLLIAWISIMNYPIKGEGNEQKSSSRR